MRYLIIFLSVLWCIGNFTVKTYAETPIYCPETKELVYYYKYENVEPGTIVYASDFRPAREDIPQPIETDPMVCPGTDIPLNGYVWWFWEKGYPKPRIAHPCDRDWETFSYL